MRHYGVGAGSRDPHVLARLCRLARLGVFVDLAVAVGVEHERRPALRLGGIARLLPHLGVDPARHRTGAREPQRFVGVVAELRVMGAETGIDEAVFHRLGIEHRHLASRQVERKRLGRGMVRALPAEGRILDTAHCRGKPHPALPVEHAIVVVGPLLPDLLLSPVGRGRKRLGSRSGVERGAERFGRVRIRDRRRPAAAACAWAVHPWRRGRSSRRNT